MVHPGYHLAVMLVPPYQLLNTEIILHLSLNNMAIPWLVPRVLGAPYNCGGGGIISDSIKDLPDSHTSAHVPRKL